jgi:hypothetical protein
MKRTNGQKVKATPPGLPIEGVLKALGTLGLTNEEMATVFGLSSSSFSTFLTDNPALYDLLQEAKDAPNRRVEASLYRRALGYQTREVVKAEGRPIKVTIKDMAPDVIAAIFWLKNRDPKRWRDTLDVTHSLRDRFDRAHHALRFGGDKLSLPSSMGENDEEIKM